MAQKDLSLICRENFIYVLQESFRSDNDGMGIQQWCHKVGMDGLLYSLENLIHHAERKLFLFLGTV